MIAGRPPVAKCRQLRPEGRVLFPFEQSNSRFSVCWNLKRGTRFLVTVTGFQTRPSAAPEQGNLRAANGTQCSSLNRHGGAEGDRGHLGPPPCAGARIRRFGYPHLPLGALDTVVAPAPVRHGLGAGVLDMVPLGTAVEALVRLPRAFVPQQHNCRSAGPQVLRVSPWRRPDAGRPCARTSQHVGLAHHGTSSGWTQRPCA